MKILFYGDSITDAGRNREGGIHMDTLGVGYVRGIADRLQGSEPGKYEIVNRGISGNRVVDLYARIKVDAWNLQPDVLSILIGVNDIWHELTAKNGVDIHRFEAVYRMMIADTKKVLPNTKIVLCEPFVLMGIATQNTENCPNRWEHFCEVYQYAKVVKKLAQEFNLLFLPLQEKLTQSAEKTKTEYYLVDGVHPNVAGATLIADEWVKLFKKEIENN
ncbi:MAG: SGNH/GDSL hydrolase family protein [Clostridia bacterium]|nr:SGNH/GDSL hydrolase family protein [Clostridia bacterium]